MTNIPLSTVDVLRSPEFQSHAVSTISTLFSAVGFLPTDTVEIRCIRAAQSGLPPQVKSLWGNPASVIASTAKLTELNADGFNIFFGVNPRPMPGQKGDKNITSAYVYFADFDCTTSTEAISRLSTAGLSEDITLLVQSGHGIHPYFRPDMPQTNMAEWTEFQKRLAATVDSDAAVVNPERVLRLPPFYNLKDSASPASTGILLDRSYISVEKGTLESKLAPLPATSAPEVNLPPITKIKNGNRNKYLYGLSGKLRRAGLGHAAISAALQSHNREICDPPLDMREVESITGSICKHAPGQIDSGGTGKGISEPFRALVTPLSAVEARKKEWLWPGRIILRGLTLISGHAGVGKSAVLMDLVGRITNGTPWADGSASKIGHVVYISREEPAETLKERATAMSADLSRIHLFNAGISEIGSRQKAFSLENIPMFEDAILTAKKYAEQQGEQLTAVIIDTLTSVLGSGTDLHRANEMADVLTPISVLAEKYNLSVIVAAHIRKGGAARADEAVMGSSAIVSIARSTFFIVRDRNDKNVRKFLAGKSNVAKEAPGLLFHLDSGSPPRVIWGGEITEDADSYFEESFSGRPPVKRDEAESFLRIVLSDGDPHSAKELIREAAQIGVHHKSLQRARKQLGIVPQRKTGGNKGEGGWYWQRSGLTDR